jgi:hypothetical protein
MNVANPSHLFAALVAEIAGGGHTGLARARLALRADQGRQDPVRHLHMLGERALVGQHPPAHIADVLHAAVDGAPVGDPTIQRVEALGALVAGDVLERAVVLAHGHLVGEDLAAGLAGEVVVLLLEVLPQPELCQAVALAAGADGGSVPLLHQLLPPRIFVQHFL